MPKKVGLFMIAMFFVNKVNEKQCVSLVSLVSGMKYILFDSGRLYIQICKEIRNFNFNLIRYFYLTGNNDQHAEYRINNKKFELSVAGHNAT